MTPLPASLLTGARPKSLIAWRLDKTAHAPTWNIGIGAQKFGGRWSPVGVAAIYAALEPATSILEVAVHSGFKALDTMPHVLVGIEILKPKAIHIVRPADVPNPNWLRPGSIGAGQQAFGAALLAAHPFVLIPSVVSTRSWNLLINPVTAAGLFQEHSQEPFALDTRLNPPAK